MKKKVLIVTSPLRVGGFDVVATSLQMHLDRERFESAKRSARLSLWLSIAGQR